MQCLQVKLLLRFLGNRLEIGAQGSFCNRHSIVVIVFLALIECLHVNRRNDSGLKPHLPHLAQRSADKMRAQAGFHAYDTFGQALKRCDQRHALNLLAQHKLPVFIKTNQVKNIFADINANRH